MNALILVSSETGYTRKYADWISEITGFPVYESDVKSGIDFSEQDIIIFGSPIYGGELLGKKMLKKILKQTDTTKIICFATGIYPWSASYEKKLRKNVLENEEPDVSFYYFTGGLDKEKLKSSRKTELFLYRMMMKRHPDREEKEAILLERTDHSGDYTDKEMLKPLLDELENIKK